MSAPQSGSPVSPRVLVVEDDRGMRDALRLGLAEEGYDVAVAGNGVEALAELSRAGRPAVILLDLEMPVMNGWEFRSAVRSDPRFGKIPIVVLSGHVESHVLAHANGVEFVLKKPIRLEELLAFLGRYTKR